MALKKFDPNLLARQCDDRLLRAWSTAEENLAKKERDYEANSRRKNVSDQGLAAKYGMPEARDL